MTVPALALAALMLQPQEEPPADLHVMEWTLPGLPADSVPCNDLISLLDLPVMIDLDPGLSIELAEQWYVDCDGGSDHSLCGSPSVPCRNIDYLIDHRCDRGNAFEDYVCWTGDNCHSRFVEKQMMLFRGDPP